MPADTTSGKGSFNRIRKKLSRLGLDAVLVTDEADLIYLTGYSSHPSARLLVPRKGPPVYFTDTMNERLARKMIKGPGRENIVSGRAPMGMLKAFLKERKIRKLGINEDSLSAREYKAIAGRGKKLLPKDASVIMEELREIKQKGEISLIRKAARESVKIWREVRGKIVTGMSEKEIASMLSACIHGRGYTHSFSPIVAIGGNSAYPHAVPTGKRLHRGEHVLVDFGIRHAGYCSDLTRTWDNGRIDRQMRDLRKYVLTAHDMAIKEIKAGMGIGPLVKKINCYFNINNLKEYVLHGLGHGLGLCVHEKPLLGEETGERFRKNMVVTVEPGLYKAGLGGMREEDMVLVTSKGCEVLTV